MIVNVFDPRIAQGTQNEHRQKFDGSII